MKKSIRLSKTENAVLNLMVLSIIIYWATGYIKLHHSFDIFYAKSIHGHIQHSSKKGHGYYLNLAEDSDNFYFAYLVEKGAKNNRAFDAIVQSGDSIAKPANADTLELFKSDGVHRFFVNK